MTTPGNTYPNAHYNGFSAMYANVTSWDNAKRFQDSLTPYLAIFQVLQISANESYVSSDSCRLPPTPAVSECALWFCVEALNVSVNQGVQSQTVVSTWSEYIDNMPPPSSHQDLEPTQYDSHGASVDYPKPENWMLQVDTQELNSEEVSYFSIQDSFLEPIQDHLAETFQESVIATNEYIESTSDSMLSLYVINNVSAVVSNLAQSMTNHIRTTQPSTISNTTIISSNGTINGSSVNANTSSQPQDDRCNGTAFYTEPIFHVRWVWLILPALLSFLSPIFLLATMWSSWKRGLPAWGSAPLALMYCGIDENVKNKLRTTEKSEVIEQRAKRIRVRLVRHESGGAWGFEEVCCEEGSEE